MRKALHPQQASSVRSIERPPFCISRDRYTITVALLLSGIGSCPAEDAAEKANERMQEVVIQAKRQAADEEVTREVRKNLTSDPWIFAEHVTITTENGVVRLEGFVGDTGERFRILRRCRKIPGTRRVVDALEVVSNDPDGG